MQADNAAYGLSQPHRGMMPGSGEGEKNPKLPWTTADPPAALVHRRAECWCGIDHSIVPLTVAEACRRITAGEPLQPLRERGGRDGDR